MPINGKICYLALQALFLLLGLFKQLGFFGFFLILVLFVKEHFFVFVALPSVPV